MDRCRKRIKKEKDICTGKRNAPARRHIVFTFLHRQLLLSLLPELALPAAGGLVEHRLGVLVALANHVLRHGVPSVLVDLHRSHGIGDIPEVVQIKLPRLKTERKFMLSNKN